MKAAHEEIYMKPSCVSLQIYVSSASEQDILHIFNNLFFQGHQVINLCYQWKLSFSCQIHVKQYIMKWVKSLLQFGDLDLDFKVSQTGL